MNRGLQMPGIVVVLVAVSLLAALGKGDEPPPINELHGTVVLAADGRPAAGVTVVMASREKGYIYFAETGLHGAGEEEKVLWFFTRRNSKQFCVAVTDKAGRFTLRNFASPEGQWIVAAGDRERGYGLQTSVRPLDYKDKPLRIEIVEPAFINTTPPSPPDKSLQVNVMVALAPVAFAPPSSEAGKDVNADSEDTTDRVFFFSPSSWRRSKQKPMRLGPLPGGQTYRVTAYAAGSNVPYQATIFERTVSLAAGATADVTLESKEGAAVTGRITSSKDEPLAYVNVTVKTTDGLVVGTLTDDDGKYELRGVPAGTHQLKLLRHAKRKTPG